jgi:hypothetical protein
MINLKKTHKYARDWAFLCCFGPQSYTRGATQPTFKGIAIPRKLVARETELRLTGAGFCRGARGFSSTLPKFFTK